MTGQVEQWICIRCCIKLEQSSLETIWMNQKAAAMGNWWLAALSRQHTFSCITSHAVFWQNIRSPRWLSPDLVPCHLGLFPKLESPLKGKRLQTIDEIQENRTGQLMVIGRTVWGPKVPVYFKGHWGVIVLCTMFLVSCLFFNKCLFFIVHGWIPSGQNLLYTIELMDIYSKKKPSRKVPINDRFLSHFFPIWTASHPLLALAIFRL